MSHNIGQRKSQQFYIYSIGMSFLQSLPFNRRSMACTTFLVESGPAMLLLSHYFCRVLRYCYDQNMPIMEQMMQKGFTDCVGFYQAMVTGKDQWTG